MKTHPYVSAPLPPRFWSKVAEPDMPEGCSLWTASRTHDGYGQFGIGGSTFRTHRLVWESANGPVPEGLSVLHHCDVPSCVSLRHLYVGTQADNNRDKAVRGRVLRMCGDDNVMHREPWRAVRGDTHPFRVNPDLHAKGERSAGAKLTAEKVREIRRLHAGGMSQTALGPLFGVTQMTIGHVVRGLTWKHV